MKRKAEALPKLIYSEEAEQAALGCVLRAGIEASQAEVDALLVQLRPQLFYDLKHRAIHDAMARLRLEGHAVDSVTLQTEIKRSVLNESLHEMVALAMKLPDMIPSVLNFPTYLAELKRCWLRRWTAAKAVEFGELAASEALNPEDLTRRFAEVHEFAGRIGASGQAKIPIITWDAIQKFVPDPKTYLIGENIISYGDVFCLAGWQGLGKSRLLNTLAFAGARGSGDWMGYTIRRKFKTLVLITETEGSMRRLKSEIEGLPPAYSKWVNFSICRLDFADPQFRDELKRLYDREGFDMLLVDHWSDVTRDEGKADYQEAFESVLHALPRADRRPAVGFAVHMRKLRGGEQWSPKIGRALLSEIMGASYISQKARTVFALQAASMDLEDDRLVFETAKCNDGEPNERSAWHRRNGAFQPCPEFDFDAWLNPPETQRGGRRRGDPEALLKEALPPGRRCLRKRIAETLAESHQASQSTVYRWLDKAIADGKAEEDADGLIAWRWE